MDLENNKCIFSGLKFNTTSYNHDVSYLYIYILALKISYHNNTLSLLK